MKEKRGYHNRKVLCEWDSNKIHEHVSLPGERFYPRNDVLFLLNVRITDFFVRKKQQH